MQGDAAGETARFPTEKSRKEHGLTGTRHKSKQDLKTHDHHGDHHAHMVEDFKKRFWVSLAITLP
ncbi:MAG: hypothetical protein ACOCQI_04635, partial [Desulfosalsimonas sp.]